MKAIKICH